MAKSFKRVFSEQSSPSIQVFECHTIPYMPYHTYRTIHTMNAVGKTQVSHPIRWSPLKYIPSQTDLPFLAALCAISLPHDLAIDVSESKVSAPTCRLFYVYIDSRLPPVWPAICDPGDDE